MHKLTATLLIAIVALLAGCGSQPTPAPAAIPAPQTAAPLKLTIAGAVARNTNNGEGVAKWAELLAAESGGKITVDAHYGDLGGDAQILSQVQSGALDGIFVITDSITTLEPRLGVFSLPFMFATHKQAYAVQDGALGQQLLKSDALKQKGLIGLAYSDLGFRNFASNQRPIAKPADLAGQKMRVLESKTAQDTMTALGATPVPMGANELYAALQQKTIDGLDMPVPYALSSKLYEVLKYYTTSRHTFTSIVFLFNAKVWERLTPDQQKALTSATQKAAAWHRDYDRNLEESGLKDLQAKGLKVNALDDPSAFAGAMQKVYDDAAKRVGADTIDAARKLAQGAGA